MVFLITSNRGNERAGWGHDALGVLRYCNTLWLCVCVCCTVQDLAVQCGKVEWKWKWSRLQGSAVQYVKFFVLSLLGFFPFFFSLLPRLS